MEQVEKKRKAFLPVVFIYSLDGELLSLSRAAWVGTFAGVTLVLFYRSWKIVLFLVLGMVTAAFIIASYYPDSAIGGLISSSIHPFQRGGVRFGTNIERLQMMKDAVSILKKDPLTESARSIQVCRHRETQAYENIYGSCSHTGNRWFDWFRDVYMAHIWFCPKMPQN